MRKKNTGLRAIFTSAVLLILVVTAAWTVKARSQKEKEQEAVEAEAPQPAETPSEVPGEEPQKPPEPAVEEPETDPAAEEEEQRAARERESFVTDYTSAPLLETTPIKCLSMEVGERATEVRFNWMSPSGAAGQVVCKNPETGETLTFTAECTASSTMPGYYVNKAVVSELQPGASYAYQVGNDAGGWSPEYQFDVPDTGNDITFLVTSDAQIGQSENDDISVTIDTWDKVVTRLVNYVPEAQFLLHNGDQVAVYGDAEQYDGFLNHLALYRIPLAPVVGNHDVPNENSMEETGLPGLPYFYEHFYVPNRSGDGCSQYDKDGDYYFVRGDVLFIVLNSSTIQPSDTHETYVRAVVDDHKDIKWKIVIQHFPAYSSVEHYQKKLDPWIAASLAYLSEPNEIDLILTGHDHAYSRSKFVDGSCRTIEGYDYASGATAMNPEGTLYVTCGTASGCIYQQVTPEEHIAFQGQPEVPTALKIDVTENDLHITSYLVDSWSVYDEYTIHKE